MAKIFLKRVKEIGGCGGCYFDIGATKPCKRNPEIWWKENEKHKSCSVDKFIYIEVKRVD